MTERAFSSAAEEAARLVDALGQWVSAANLAEHLPGGSGECRLCPVCQLLGMVRHARPDVVAHLEDAVASLLAAARAALEAADDTCPRGAGFERIDIG